MSETNRFICNAPAPRLLMVFTSAGINSQRSERVGCVLWFFLKLRKYEHPPPCGLLMRDEAPRAAERAAALTDHVLLPPLMAEDDCFKAIINNPLPSPRPPWLHSPSRTHLTSPEIWGDVVEEDCSVGQQPHQWCMEKCLHSSPPWRYVPLHQRWLGHGGNKAPPTWHSRTDLWQRAALNPLSQWLFLTVEPGWIWIWGGWSSPTSQPLESHRLHCFSFKLTAPWHRPGPQISTW